MPSRQSGHPISLELVRMRQAAFLRAVPIAFLSLGLGCQDLPPTASLAPARARHAMVVVPAEGSSTTLDFGTWNLEWFGDVNEGPSNETLQLENVRDVILGTDLDIWGFQEVVNGAHFSSLVSQLPGYAGFLANDPSVTNGPEYYSDFDNNEQKVGIAYKTGMASVQGARVILTAYDYEFAGRPPLEVTMSVTLNGVTENIVVIVLHAKAGTGGTDYDRRLAGSQALKSYLDATYPTGKVIVIGDFNDDVDVSIVKPKASPYANFVADSTDYRFPTKALSDAGITSTVYYRDMIDHHLATNEFWAVYAPASAEVLRVDQYIADYDQSTSDHYPVKTQYTDGSGSGGGGGGTTSIALGTRGYKTRGVAYVDLTWTGATSTSVDVYRNGAKVTTTANDGAHTDSLGKVSGTFTYKVCEAATTTCSNESSVTF
jgi:endonuclease/exonuclease/phosphatase family metal-dependent hydrolase